MLAFIIIGLLVGLSSVQGKLRQLFMYSLTTEGCEQTSNDYWELFMFPYFEPMIFLDAAL